MLVIGAGADHVYGVPTVGSLLGELAAFATGDGAAIDKALRKKLPYLRFSFDKYASDQGDELIGRLFSDASDLVPTLRSAAGKLKGDEDFSPLASVLERLCLMAENNQLQRADLAALAKFGGVPGDVGDVEPIINPKGLTLTPIPGNALRGAFHRALVVGGHLNDHEREVFSLFVEATSNVEELLSHFFTLSATGKASDQRTYLYLVWMLWAFLQSRSANRLTMEQSIYAKARFIGDDVVTFNYTNFFPDSFGQQAKFFHGRLDRYLRLDDRAVVSDDTLRRVVDLSGIERYLEARRLDARNWPMVDVPDIVPPTSFKPVLSREQLRTWVSVDDVLRRATLVIVVGYSFALADEHFNDLLRHSNDKSRVLVVNPDVAQPMVNVCRVLGIPDSSLAESSRGGFGRWSAGRLIYVQAKAEDVASAFVSEMIR